MNLSEFINLLGSDPASQDPAFLRARESSDEFKQVAADSDLFESRLAQALLVPAPENLVRGLKDIAQTELSPAGGWRIYALAASVLLAVAATGLVWRVNNHSGVVEQYVSHHYSLDGASLVVMGEGQLAANVSEVLSQLQVALTAETASMVGYIKFCPTPDGTGAHLVLNTRQGPITVIFMPGTVVKDGEMLEFEGLQAQLVYLGDNSAVIIGSEQQEIAGFHDLVQSAFVPLRT